MKRKTFLTLMLAIVVVLTFSMLSPKWLFPFCAWIAPATLLIFIEQYKPARGLLLGWVLLFVASGIANYKVMPFPTPFMIIVTLQTTLIGMLPYVLNKLLTNSYQRFVWTLIFPAAAVAIEYVSSFYGGGTWGSIAYTQADNISIAQLASLTGLWGVSFMIYWFNAIIFWAWKWQLDWSRLRLAAIGYLSIMAGIYSFGIIRTNPYFSNASEKVRVAGITDLNLAPVFQMYEDAFGKALPIAPSALTQTSPELQELNKGLIEFVSDPLNTKFKKTHDALVTFYDRLFARAKREADAGAKLISFSEALFFTMKPIEGQLISKGVTFAKDNNVHLVLPIASFLPGKIEFGTKYIENKAIVIGPDGEVKNTFFKNKPVPVVEGSFPGDGNVPVIKTEFGNVATSICYDADFPSLMRQAGQKDSDILVLPSGDWKEVSPYHSSMARIRAIENGFSLLRPVSGATSIACDYFGRVVTSRDFYDEGEKTIVAYLPTKGKKTIYSLIGDVLPVCCIGALFIAALIVVRDTLRRRLQNVPVTVPN